MLQTTLGLIIKDGKIFLGEKKRGYAKGVLNGVGGKVDLGETIENCIIRETKEEIGVDIIKMENIGILHFFFGEGKEKGIDVHLFKILEYSGEPIETEEIKPFWFSINEIPYDKMWSDDIIWLNRVINGEKNLEYTFWFDSDSWDSKLLKYEKIS